MITYSKGDLFRSSAQCLVNPVNTQGVMGKGLALAFKDRFPKMFAAYTEQCRRGTLIPGKLMLYKKEDPWVLIFPTKIQVYRKSELSYIESGLQKFCATYKERGITSIAFPALGCGEGGLSWTDVRPVMEKYLSTVKIPVEVFEPMGNEAK